jgi:hypothetical protein
MSREDIKKASMKKEEMFLPTENKSKYADLPLHFYYIEESDPNFERYVELISMMRISFVEQIILAKMAEIKVIAKGRD